MVFWVNVIPQGDPAGSVPLLLTNLLLAIVVNGTIIGIACWATTW